MINISVSIRAPESTIIGNRDVAEASWQLHPPVVILPSENCIVSVCPHNVVLAAYVHLLQLPVNLLPLVPILHVDIIVFINTPHSAIVSHGHMLECTFYLGPATPVPVVNFII